MKNARKKRHSKRGETCQILILFFASKGRAAKKRPTSEILWLKRKILALMPRHLWFWDIYLALQFLIKTLAWLSEILRVDRMGNFCSLGQEKKRKVKRSPYQKSSFTKVLSLSQLERGVTVVVILQCQVFNKNLGSWSRQQIFQLANSCIGMATIQKCENPPEPSFLWDSSVAMEYRYHIIDYYNTCCIQSLYWERRAREETKEQIKGFSCRSNISCSELLLYR